MVTERSIQAPWDKCTQLLVYVNPVGFHLKATGYCHILYLWTAPNPRKWGTLMFPPQLYEDKEAGTRGGWWLERRRHTLSSPDLNLDLCWSTSYFWLILDINSTMETKRNMQAHWVKCTQLIVYVNPVGFHPKATGYCHISSLSLDSPQLLEMTWCLL